MDNENFFDRVGTERAHHRVGISGGDTASVSIAPQPIAPDAQLVSMKRWSAANDIFRGAAETYDALPAGLYRIDVDQYGAPFLIKQKHETDDLLELPDDASTAILQEFDDFWDRREKFKERGFLHKRGFLLWGPPGSGKTSCVNILIRRLIKNTDGIVLFIDHPLKAAIGLRMLRLIEPARPVVAILEDIDALIMRHDEHEFLALLDGEAQVDRIVFVATTNYPERLDRRFCDRPSRFDTIQYIGMPSGAARLAYLKAKEKSLSPAELDRWVAATDGFSLAHLKELIVAVHCLGQSFEDAVDRLEGMRVTRPSSDDEPSRVSAGFIGKRNGALAPV